MVVTDNLKTLSEDDKQFFVVLFSVYEEVKSSHLLKFHRPEKAWVVEPTKDSVTHPDNFQAKFVNGFRVRQDQILLITWYRTLVYSTDLEVLNSTDVIHDVALKTGL